MSRAYTYLRTQSFVNSPLKEAIKLHLSQVQGLRLKRFRP
jgi:hypothetical protein